MMSILMKPNTRAVSEGNSGYLKFCSAHICHDNPVTYESEIAHMDNAYEVQGVCRAYLGMEENYAHHIYPYILENGNPLKLKKPDEKGVF